MARRRPLPEYDKNDRAKEFFRVPNREPFCSDVFDCVKVIFPDTRPGDFQKWIKKVEKKSLKVELLLIMALACGAHFRVSHVDIKEVLEELWKWLTWKDNKIYGRYMTEDIAELVIAALEPGIKRAIQERGYLQGWPRGKYVRKKGRPVQARGAWVAAILIDNYLRQSGIKAAESVGVALGLAAILLGRKEAEIEKETTDEKGKAISHSEYYRISKKAPKETVSKLIEMLQKEYFSLLKQDAINGSKPIDLPPEKDATIEYSEWESRHKSFQHYVRRAGCDSFCSAILYRIPERLWGPFWDLTLNKLANKKRK